MIGRRAFLATAALAALTAPRLGEALASTSPRVPRVGVLGEVNPIPWSLRTPVVDIECRWADARRERLGDLASQLLALDVDVVVALGAASARAVSQRTTQVPIVALVDADLEEHGTLASLARSVDNVVWISPPSETGMAQQRMRILGRLIPHFRRLAVVFNADSVAHARTVAHLLRPEAAPVAEVLSLPARSVDDVERLLGGRARDLVDGALILTDTLFTEHAGRLAELMTAASLPAAYGAPGFVEAGGLMSLHGDTGELIRRTATVVQRILAGAKPATLSPPPPPPPHVVVNIAAARRLGLRTPSMLLARAEVLTSC